VFAALGDRADQFFPFFFRTWIVFGAICFLVFCRGHDADRKRRLFRPFVVGTPCSVQAAATRFDTDGIALPRS
jgi:hypothetical protein